MTSAVAAAAADGASGAIVIVVLAVIGLYILAGLFWPFASCRKCNGGGRLRSPARRYWRACPRCGGTGRRLRFIAQLRSAPPQGNEGPLVGGLPRRGRIRRRTKDPQ